ncbi:MAG: peptidylprolyl isomerase [Gammaproteobacteria bacterium]|jgi:cyclophilin family peptidyl-prolyl cis-trans isomerase|nr:peptidylprolyl isomerase [Chromatiales bacterium]MCP4927071.1 peptidyl-prolyl cis-trans isomerase [Gammaproteobacteria bacterium]MDP7094165.1 peptidylprolyl isomerase [Gammaproteobacteria bacterium]MDP7296888.1 peptidylprolyl isomerase [Gammaproteobacteria bacterium]MDP7419474.1 peptidylprolyl isomerase [Gammaproteobacteria bacterium]
MKYFFIKALTGILLVSSGTASAAEFPQVRVETTAGAFVLQLNDERAPLTVANFLQYVESGHYVDTIFHRVVSGFVIQGGGFSADHVKKKAPAPIPNESGNGLANRRMTIAMARTPDPHSADAQFYINLADNPALDPKPTRWGYAVFGEVISGEDIIDDIGHRATSPKGPFQHLPAAPVIIEQVTREK